MHQIILSIVIFVAVYILCFTILVARKNTELQELQQLLEQRYPTEIVQSLKDSDC